MNAGSVCRILVENEPSDNEEGGLVLSQSAELGHHSKLLHGTGFLWKYPGMAAPGSGTVRRRTGSNPAPARGGSVEGSRENKPESAALEIRGSILAVRLVREKPTPHPPFFCKCGI